MNKYGILTFTELREEVLDIFVNDMKEAFRDGSIKGMGKDEDVLPEEDIYDSLNTEGAKGYVVIKEGEIVGGAIVVINDITNINYLDFLYVKVGHQGKHIGQYIWREIEKRYPDTVVWKTCTPYFDKRNIHFYINCCGFSAVEFFDRFHPDNNKPAIEEDDCFDGMFLFEKSINKKF